MARIEWAMWANEQAVVSAWCLLMGGIVGVAGSFKNWQFAACAIVESVLILVLEWPRSKRVQGNTRERRLQKPLTKLLSKLRPLSSNYYVRFVLHIVLSVPCCFLLPTIMGGMSLLITALIYLVAAVKGEEWRPSGLDPPPSGDAQPGPTPSGLPDMPQRPPPRRQAAETSLNQI